MSCHSFHSSSPSPFNRPPTPPSAPAILPGNMSDIPNAAAVRPAGRCCHPSVGAITCQPATHALHPAATCPPAAPFCPAKRSGNMLDIPDAATARPAHPLPLKFRVKYLQVELIMCIQEYGQRTYPQHMIITRQIGACVCVYCR
jgi:hypothetical protein